MEAVQGFSNWNDLWTPFKGEKLFETTKTHLKTAGRPLSFRIIILRNLRFTFRKCLLMAKHCFYNKKKNQKAYRMCRPQVSTTPNLRNIDFCLTPSFLQMTERGPVKTQGLPQATQMAISKSKPEA